ncbi:MAG TPA: site-specific integrase [Anaerolineales bacterium]|nr:site-specific integrase [Anaerolineales bacterium]
MSPQSDPVFTSAHISAQSPVAPTINAWRIYLEDQGSSPHTVKAFTADVNLLASYLPPDRTLGSVTTTEINNFLSWMQKGRGVPCSPKTLARRITSVKAFFRWLHENGAILIDPAEKVIQRSVISPLPTVLTPQESQDVLMVAESHRQGPNPDGRYYALAGLLLHTGIKKSECLALNLNHLELDAPKGPFIFVRYASPQHRYKERKIPVPESWLEAYHEYKAQYGLTERLFPWSQRRLEYLLEDLSEEAGLDKHLSFEMCRWTCALADWQSGMERDKIRQKLGISKVQWREISMKLRKLSRNRQD